MRVAGFEFRERPFGLVKRGFEEGVAVAGEHYVVAGVDVECAYGVLGVVDFFMVGMRWPLIMAWQSPCFRVFAYFR